MDTTQANQALIAAENYEKNVVTYTTGPFAGHLLENADLQPGERILDVACGTGIIARMAALRVGPSGIVVGIDISAAMLAVARSIPPLNEVAVNWQEGDAQALPFPDHSFDWVFCQAGLMFFPDRPAALKEMQRVLRSGGRIAISVWRSLDHQPVAKLIWEAIARHLNTNVSLLAYQYSLGDAGELRALLESAGFIEVAIVPRTHTVRRPRNPDLIADILTSVSSVMPNFAALSAEEKSTLAQAVEREIRPELQTYVERDEITFPTSAHIASARKI